MATTLNGQKPLVESSPDQDKLERHQLISNSNMASVIAKEAERNCRNGFPPGLQLSYVSLQEAQLQFDERAIAAVVKMKRSDIQIRISIMLRQQGWSSITREFFFNGQKQTIFILSRHNPPLNLLTRLAMLLGIIQKRSGHQRFESFD